MLNNDQLKKIIEGALFAFTDPLSVGQLMQLFEESDEVTTEAIEQALEDLTADYQNKGVHLQRVASGYRFQTIDTITAWLHRLWEKKPSRYSRAFLEILALIAYRQPISRGEIEAIRGVSISTDIIKKMLEQEWIKVVGFREMPGKPALFGTTKQFLDYFNLKNLSDLPPLPPEKDLEASAQRLNEQLALSIKESID